MMHPTARHSLARYAMLLLTGGCIVLAAALSFAPAARAEARWIVGESKSTWAFQCWSGNYGWGAGAYTAVYMDPDNPPVVGEPFALAINVLSIGHPCGEPQYAGMYFALPPGVVPADQTAYPPVCFAGNYNTNYTGQVPGSCPAAPTFTPEGWLMPSTNFSAGYWPLAMDRRYNSLVPSIDFGNSSYVDASGVWVEVHMFVTANRTLSGEAISTPVRILDGDASPWLVPSIPMTVAPRPQGPTGPDGIEDLFRASKSLRIRTVIRKGYSFKINVPHGGSAVKAVWTAKIRGRTRTIATFKRAELAAGPITAKLKLTRRAAKLLRRQRRVSSTITVTSTTKFDGHADDDRARVVLKR